MPPAFPYHHRISLLLILSSMPLDACSTIATTAAVGGAAVSVAGTPTLVHAVEERLHHLGVRSYVLDGDNVRHGLCGDLDFSAQDRTKNIRRIGEVAKLFVDAGVMVLTAFISVLQCSPLNI